MQVVQERIGVSISGQTTVIVVATRMWYQMVRGRAPMESIGCWLAEVSLDEVGRRLPSSTPNVRSVSRPITVTEAPESGVAVIVEVRFPSKISTWIDGTAREVGGVVCTAPIKESVTLSTLRAVLPWHTLAKWFGFLHAEQVLPLAGHVWSVRWDLPQLGHVSGVWALGGCRWVDTLLT